jgi:hypothetical protein
MSTIKSPACRVTTDTFPIWKLLRIGTLVLLTLIWAAGYGFTQETWKETWKPLGGIGVIDRFEGDEIVIDDSFYRLASDVNYYQSHKMLTFALRSSFKVGKWVGFKLNDDGKISALWFSKKGG